MSTISFICSRNQLSIFDKFCIVLILIFFLKASATSRILLGTFFFKFFSNSFLFSDKILSKPEKPISRDIRAFCRDSLKFLPIAIASPTDFIEVPKIASDVENFSKVNLGIFVTT